MMMDTRDNRSPVDVRPLEARDLEAVVALDRSIVGRQDQRRGQGLEAQARLGAP